MPGIPHNLSTHTMNHAVEVIFHCKISGHLTYKVRGCYRRCFSGMCACDTNWNVCLNESYFECTQGSQNHALSMCLVGFNLPVVVMLYVSWLCSSEIDRLCTITMPWYRWIISNLLYRSGTVNSKSFVGKVLLRIKWKFELTYAL